jgi:CRISPR-associated RAMP protein (TIGR02581 family)
MTAFFGHHCLQNRYQFHLKLTLKTPLRLSSGRASDETDAPLMRCFDGTPLIPGTSLRGAIRSEVERIISAVGPASGLRSCSLFSESEVDKDCAAKFRKYQTAEEATGEALSDQEIADFAQQNLCDVCKLFGSALYASRLVIEDAVADEKYPSRIRDGVGIDRDTGAAREGVKFDYEVLEPEGMKEIVFTGAMRVENLTNKDKALLGLILNLLRQGLYVGGKRAAGLGKIRLREEPVIKGFASPAELWRRLRADEPICQTISTWDKVAPC